MRRNLRKILFAILILAVLFALAYRSRKAMHVQDFSFSKLVHAIAQANGWLLLLGLLSIYSCYAIRSLRWNALCRHLGHTTFLRTFAGTLEGFATIFILGRAGDPVRPLLLARKDRLPASSMFGIYVLERLFDFASYVGLFTIGILVFPHQLMDAGVDQEWISKAHRFAWILLALIAVIVAALIYFRLHGAGRLERRIKSWQDGSGFREKCSVMFNGFSQGMQAMSSVSDLLIAIGYSAVHWSLVAFAYFAIARAFGDPLSSMNYPGAMLLLSITLLGSILQLPGVGGGAQVASIIALTTVFNVDQEAAVVVAVVLWLITFAAVTVTGIPLLIHEGWSIGDLRRLAKQEAEAEKAGSHVAAIKPSHPHGKDLGDGESSK
jgi:glycosyltransferase 2 family protein